MTLRGVCIKLKCTHYYLVKKEDICVCIKQKYQCYVPSVEPNIKNYFVNNYTDYGAYEPNYGQNRHVSHMHGVRVDIVMAK